MQAISLPRLFPIGLVRLVECEAGLEFRLVLDSDEFHGLALPLDGGIEVAGCRVSSRKCVQIAPILPIRQFARHGGIINGSRCDAPIVFWYAVSQRPFSSFTELGSFQAAA